MKLRTTTIARTQAALVAALLAGAPIAATAQDEWLPDDFDQLDGFSFENPLAKLAGAMITGGSFALLAGQDETPLSS